VRQALVILELGNSLKNGDKSTFYPGLFASKIAWSKALGARLTINALKTMTCLNNILYNEFLVQYIFI
jgi:phosphopantetheinyl transferase (holo-ACP synthase)